MKPPAVRARLFFLPCLLASSHCLLLATEITTGALLGPDYDRRAFYVRQEPGDVWRKTYTGLEYRLEAQGKLMNLRLAQALFHDEWMTEQPFDPGNNTESLIEALGFYRTHGVLMINVSLQGGNAGYDKTVNGIDRQNGYRYGPAKGTYVSAFQPDGSLKEDWLPRIERLLKVTNGRGMIVNVMYFYQGQDEQFASTAAIDAAARNITAWLIEQDYRNVIIDVANEWDLRGDRWDFDRYIPRNIERLVRQTQEQFRKSGWFVPVSASSDGRMEYPESLIDVSDIVMIHGNGRTPDQKTSRTEELKSVRKPVLMNEDDNGRATTIENLAKELRSCTILFENAAGWGYMPWVQAQRFPFRFMPGNSPAVRDEMPEAERDPAYFHAVLDHIAALTLRQPPCNGTKNAHR